MSLETPFVAAALLGLSLSVTPPPEISRDILDVRSSVGSLGLPLELPSQFTPGHSPFDSDEPWMLPPSDSCHDGLSDLSFEPVCPKSRGEVFLNGRVALDGRSSSLGVNTVEIVSDPLSRFLKILGFSR